MYPPSLSLPLSLSLSLRPSIRFSSAQEQAGSRALEIPKEEACKGVGAQICSLLEFGSYFADDGLANPEAFGSLTDVKARRLVSYIVPLVFFLA